MSILHPAATFQGIRRQRQQFGEVHSNILQVL